MEIRPFLDNLSDFGNKPQLQVMLETSHHKDIRIMLPKEQVIKEHSSKFPISVHVLSGNILFTVGEKEVTLKAGDLIALDSNVMHELLAYEDSVARLTMFKVT